MFSGKMLDNMSFRNRNAQNTIDMINYQPGL